VTFVGAATFFSGWLHSERGVLCKLAILIAPPSWNHCCQPMTGRAIQVSAPTWSQEIPQRIYHSWTRTWTNLGWQVNKQWAENSP
jgi:hypothetical protein